jgi:Protein kinase domain/PEGA domain
MRGGSTIDIQTGSIDVAVGAELGSYKLTSLLGEGAMGRVFKARHVRLGRTVAIKVLNPEYAARADVVKRFFREARVVNEIDHENIVEVTDFVELPGVAFLVMELLDGQSLREILKRRKGKWPPVHLSVAVMAQVCDALEAAHQKGVVHRDLKPDNIFVIQRAGRDYAKVLDFGVAKLKEPDSGSYATVTGMILGTPLYMAPEQAIGKDVDRHADVWAAGVVLYELLSGTVPFKGESFADLVTKIRDDPPKPLPDRTPRRERIPQALAAIVMKCLEKKPSDRFRSMAALAEALRTRSGLKAGAGPRSRLLPLAAAAALIGGAGWAAVRYGLPARVGEWLRPVRRAVEAPVAKAPIPDRLPPARPPETRVPEPAPARPAAVTPARPARSQAKAQHPATVELELRSKPKGATVVRLDTGELLGKTPLRVKVHRRAGDVAVRFTLDGYEPATASVDLQGGGRASVSLKKAAKRKSAKRTSARH